MQNFFAEQSTSASGSLALKRLMAPVHVSAISGISALLPRIPLREVIFTASAFIPHFSFTATHALTDSVWYAGLGCSNPAGSLAPLQAVKASIHGNEGGGFTE